MFFSTLAAAALALVGSAEGAAIPKRQQVCNGHAELCDRSYGNITYFGAHDSFAFSKDPLALAADQHVSITDQLNLGVRFLQAQAHKNDLDGEIHFCHTSCLLFDGGKVSDYLKEVKTFLDANPNEFLTFIFTNPEGLDLATVWQPAFVDAAMDTLAFVPPTPGTPIKQSDWPTLGQMLSSGKRFVTFLDAGADSGAVPFLMPEFQMVWEPPFSVTDPTFPCSVNRIAGPLATEDHMFMINHNLNKAVFGDNDILVSDPGDAKTTNGLASILANANGCSPLGGNRAPSFLLLDFVDIGDGKLAADTLNGLASAGGKTNGVRSTIPPIRAGIGWSVFACVVAVLVTEVF